MPTFLLLLACSGAPAASAVVTRLDATGNQRAVGETWATSGGCNGCSCEADGSTACDDTCDI